MAYNYYPGANANDPNNSCCYVAGCIDSTSYNYNANACIDDGSCIYFLLGCMDVLACNYDSLATQDDGSCILPDGCTDTTALNYDVTATCDDGSCIAAVYGCTDPMAYNYYPGANVNDPNNPCCYVAGCTDPLATNYDANACQDDASCTFTNCSLILGFTSLGNIGNCCYYVSNSTMSWASADTMCANS